jgi:hypothetical protein
MEPVPVSSTAIRAEEISRILELPNEIIYSILSFACGDGYLLDMAAIDPKPIDSPVLTIRSVCRKFRKICAHLPFWYEDWFNLLALRTNHNLDEIDTDEFLDALLSDPYLVEQLTRKTGWSFVNPQMIEKIIATFPSFPEKTTFLALKFIKYHEFFFPADDEKLAASLNDTIWQLKMCRQVRKLDLIPEFFPIDFNAVSTSFPQLEELMVLHPFDHTGTLAGFKHLRKLGITTPNSATPYFLPLQSANVLTHLEINFEHKEYNEIYFLNFGRGGLTDSAALDQFINLTSFSISPLSQAVLEYLIRSSSHLTEFRTSVNRFPTPDFPVPSMFSANCLQTLERLTFVLGEPHPLYKLSADAFDPTPYIRAITDITSLQTLDLSIPFREDEIHNFAKLINMKRLAFVAYIEECVFRDTETALDESKHLNEGTDNLDKAEEREGLNPDEGKESLNPDEGKESLNLDEGKESLNLDEGSEDSEWDEIDEAEEIVLDCFAAAFAGFEHMDITVGINSWNDEAEEKLRQLGASDDSESEGNMEDGEEYEESEFTGVDDDFQNSDED